MDTYNRNSAVELQASQVGMMSPASNANFQPTRMTFTSNIIGDDQTKGNPISIQGYNGQENQHNSVEP